MDPGRPSDVSPEAMQARIQQARREAETLKDRIKRKKEELADTTRECPVAPGLFVSSVCPAPCEIAGLPVFARLANQSAPSPPRPTSRSPRTS